MSGGSLTLPDYDGDFCHAFNFPPAFSEDFRACVANHYRADFTPGGCFKTDINRLR
ncbi:conserved hypothetical protein [Klebsiella variicola]|uniref:Uncharacterized protein n=1 Tax=Klebsiella quasipneumoniae TaxID=1463165 RepID=A0A7L7TH32_9ENTR|nr:Hypothetical protein [Klebsiella quasipneumoniae]QOE89825.1 Hypothetical protein [Klebsiella quasipneumoniae]CEL88588.1 conserved hypothetical protein [Klebsiella variicola]